MHWADTERENVRFHRRYLQGNKLLVNVSLTNEQANFVYTLTSFQIDAASLRTDCDDSQKFSFLKFGITVCISGGVNDKIILGSRIISSTSESSDDNSKSTDGSGSGTSEESESSTALVIGSVGSGAVVMVALIAGCYCYRSKKNKAKSTSNSTGGMGATTTGSAAGSIATYSSLWTNPDLLAVKVSVDDIQDIRKIGSGAFADVWLVQFRNSQLMASKRLHADRITPERTQAFINEIKLVKSLQHPSIVQFKGAAWIMESDLQALFEYMDGGDLRSYLVRSTDSREWGTEKLQIAIDIAEALVYVHSFAPPLVHRDLKSLNVLLTSEMRAKLTDFGVSRMQSDQNTMTSGVGTGRWLAPEVISGSNDYGSAADIFSFGAVLSELDTHELPYASTRSANGSKLADVALLQLVSTGQLKPRFDASCPEKITELAARCLAFDPADCPNALQVAYTLRTLMKQRSSMFV